MKNFGLLHRKMPKSSGKTGKHLLKIACLFWAVLFFSSLCAASEEAALFTIIQPESGTLVSSGRIRVVGRVSDSVALKSLRINDEELAIPEISGFSFSVEVELDRGPNEISVIGESDDGAVQETKLRVTRDDEPPEIGVTTVSAETDSEGKQVLRFEAAVTERLTKLSSIILDDEALEIPSDSKVFYVTKKVPAERTGLSISASDAAGNKVVWDVDLKSLKVTARAPDAEKIQPDWAAPAISRPIYEAVERERPSARFAPPETVEAITAAVDVTLNGEDFYSVALLNLREGRTYISVRSLAEVLPGGEIAENEGIIKLTSAMRGGSDEISVKPGDSTILVNGETIEIGGAGSGSDEDRALPLRNVFKALKYDVGWLHEEKKVVLKREEPEASVVAEEPESEWTATKTVEKPRKIVNEEPAAAAGGAEGSGFAARVSALVKSGLMAKAILLATILLMIALAVKIVPVVISSNTPKETRQRQREMLQAKRVRSRIKTLTREVFSVEKLSASGETERLAIFNGISGKLNISKGEHDDVFRDFSGIIKRIIDEDAFMNTKVSVSVVEDRSFKGLLVSRFALEGILRKRRTFSQDFLWFTSAGKWVCRQRVEDGRQVEIEYARGVKPWDEEG